MSTLRLSAGEDTEDLAQFVLGKLDDATLDAIEVEREHAPAHGLASEPVTVTLILTLGPPAMIVIGRLAERWLEARRQERQMRLVMEAHETSAEAGQALKDLADRHVEVAVAFAEQPMPDPGAA